MVLSPPLDADLPDVHRLHADPAVWTHLPSGRHVEEGRTREMVALWQARWAERGLDVWVARSPDGRFIGVGGCGMRSADYWNLYYRLDPSVWGQGYARELIAAARAAAGAIAPALPVIAYLLEHNEGSRRAAERSGLTLAWRGPDAGNPDAGAVRLVYADRPLVPALLEAVTR
jgi:RimJ/RimL family protein N-acetyltransferase